MDFQVLTMYTEGKHTSPTLSDRAALTRSTLQRLSASCSASLRNVLAMCCCAAVACAGSRL